MTRDEGLAQAIANRRIGWAVRGPSDAERRILGVLEASATATGEWRRLAEPGSGRWAKAKVPAPADVLDMAVRSAVLAAERLEVRRLREKTGAEYKEVLDAAERVFKYYLEEAGLDWEAYERLDPANLDPPGHRLLHAAGAIFEDLVIVTGYDLLDIDDLPRFAVREGPGAEARVFEAYLANFIERGYGRPYHGFVIWLSGELFPDAPASGEDTLARYRKRERDTRAALDRAARGSAALGGHVDTMPEPTRKPDDLPDFFLEALEASPPAVTSLAERKRQLRRVWRVRLSDDLPD